MFGHQLRPQHAMTFVHFWAMTKNTLAEADDQTLWSKLGSALGHSRSANSECKHWPQQWLHKQTWKYHENIILAYVACLCLTAKTQRSWSNAEAKDLNTWLWNIDRAKHQHLGWSWMLLLFAKVCCVRSFVSSHVFLLKAIGNHDILLVPVLAPARSHLLKIDRGCKVRTSPRKARWEGFNPTQFDLGECRRSISSQHKVATTLCNWSQLSLRFTLASVAKALSRHSCRLGGCTVVQGTSGKTSFRHTANLCRSITINLPLFNLPWKHHGRCKRESGASQIPGIPWTFVDMDKGLHQEAELAPYRTKQPNARFFAYSPCLQSFICIRELGNNDLETPQRTDTNGTNPLAFAVEEDTSNRSQTPPPSTSGRWSSRASRNLWTWLATPEEAT